ncbi:MAG TPA: hypothetical protein VN577_02120 [Terriglobales bacterium]|nr:hypothetical protein [Terriglobales bacterium]
MDTAPELPRKQSFLWGVALAWIPFLLFFGIMFRGAFRGMSETKATGVGVVYGSLAEALVLFGAVSLLGVTIAAAVMLVRSFTAGRLGRNLLISVSLACCALTILFLAILFWSALRVHQ